MMTRKDYVSTAAILNEMIDYMHPAAFATLVQKFEKMMEADNPRFSKDIFEDACYAEAN